MDIPVWGSGAGTRWCCMAQNTTVVCDEQCVVEYTHCDVG